MNSEAVAAIIAAFIATVGAIVVAVINNRSKRRRTSSQDSQKTQNAQSVKHMDGETQPSIQTSSLKKSKPVKYTPSLLGTWKTCIEAGHWVEVIDCRDEMLLHDLCSLIKCILSDHKVHDSIITNTQVAIMELCRNVAMHASEPIGLIEIGIDYDMGRLTVSTISQGRPFTLESALQKYSQSDEPMEGHGFRNLLPRGTLQVMRESRCNKVRFGCVLERKKDNISESLITIALTSHFIQLHTQKYNYEQWLAFWQRNCIMAYRQRCLSIKKKFYSKNLKMLGGFPFLYKLNWSGYHQSGHLADGR